MDRCLPSPTYSLSLLRYRSLAPDDIPLFSPKSTGKMLTSPNLWASLSHLVSPVFALKVALVHKQGSTLTQHLTCLCGEKSTGGCSERLWKYRLNKVLSQEHGYFSGDNRTEAEHHSRRPALFFFFPWTIMSQSIMAYNKGQSKRHSLKAKSTEHPCVLSLSDGVGGSDTCWPKEG